MDIIAFLDQKRCSVLIGDSQNILQKLLNGTFTHDMENSTVWTQSSDVLRILILKA